MTDLAKPVFLAAYACFGIFLVLAAARIRVKVPLTVQRVILAVFFIGSGVTLLRFLQGGMMFPVCVLCGTVLMVRDGALRSPKAFLTALAVVTTSASLAWWLDMTAQPHGWWRVTVFSLIAWCLQTGLSRLGHRPARSGTVLSVADMTPYTFAHEALTYLAHHHGAYIGLALHVLAGLAPFYDVLLQYGLGPTLSIAAACRISGCWPGFEFLTAASTWLMGLMILFMGLEGAKSRAAAWRIAAAATVFAAVFLWPGFPNLVSIPTAAPSVGGIRFLPVVLVAFFLFFNRYRTAALFFLPAVPWSLEAGFMTVAVFGVHETARRGFRSAALKTAGLGAGSYSAFVLIHRLVYGVWAQPDVMLEYLSHVPGPLPIDPFTSVLMLASGFWVAAWIVVRKHADDTAFRRDLVVSALLFAATSYYLGRSHPNNVCNLMPFLALVALRALDGSGNPAPAMSKLIVGGLATATAAIIFSFWTYVPFGQFFHARPEPLLRSIENLDSDMNAVRGRIVNPEHLGIADFGLSLTRHPEETVVWTSMDPASLWAYVPVERRRLYTQRAKERLKRSGWIVVEGRHKHSR